MIRQARRYLVGAASSVTLVSIAIVVFVVLVSAQVFRDWPIGAIGSGDGKRAVASADTVGASLNTAPGAPKTVNPAAATTAATSAPAGGAQPGASAGGTAPQDNTSLGSSAPPVTSSEPVTGAPKNGAPNRGSNPSEISSPSESGSSLSSSGGGGNATSTAAAKESGNGSSGSGPSGSGNSSKPGGGVVEEVTQPVTSGSTSAKVTETVNETVNSVDETVTGGTLKEAGVTGLTEEVVNGVAGPESVVGKTVDEVGKAVGGLLGGNK